MSEWWSSTARDFAERANATSATPEEKALFSDLLNEMAAVAIGEDDRIRWWGRLRSDGSQHDCGPRLLGLDELGTSTLALRINETGKGEAAGKPATFQLSFGWGPIEQAFGREFRHALREGLLRSFDPSEVDPVKDPDGYRGIGIGQLATDPERCATARKAAILTLAQLLSR